MDNQEHGGTQPMSRALSCPNCGAPLAGQLERPTVKYAYCGSRVKVPRAATTAPRVVRASRTRAASSSASAPGVVRQTIGCVGIAVFGLSLVAGCFLIIALIGNLVFRASGSFDLAMQTAQADPRMINAFGIPLQPGIFVTGQISGDGSHWTANYDIPISGPRHSGNLHVYGTSNSRGWNLSLTAGYQDHGEDVSIRMSYSP
jgi:hypothetical protein